MSKALSVPVENLTLREKVAEYLRNKIIYHKLQPGEKITGIALSKQ